MAEETGEPIDSGQWDTVKTGQSLVLDPLSLNQALGGLEWFSGFHSWHVGRARTGEGAAI